MTSDEALSELKRAKDKLDLGLITQAEYDSLKVELSKYIKQANIKEYTVKLII